MKLSIIRDINVRLQDLMDLEQDFEDAYIICYD